MFLASILVYCIWHLFRHSFWRVCWHLFQHSFGYLTFWHSLGHVFGCRSEQLHPQLAIGFGELHSGPLVPLCHDETWRASPGWGTIKQTNMDLSENTPVSNGLAGFSPWTGDFHCPPFQDKPIQIYPNILISMILSLHPRSYPHQLLKIWSLELLEPTLAPFPPPQVVGPFGRAHRFVGHLWSIEAPGPEPGFPKSSKFIDGSSMIQSIQLLEYSHFRKPP